MASRALVFCWAVSLAVVLGDADVKSVRDLRNDLFHNYDKLVRPVANPKTTIPLNVRLSPIALQELSSKDQILVMDSWILMEWTDSYLIWDPQEYSDISVLRVPNTEVWKPDLSLYTASPDEAFFPNPVTNVLIHNNGTVIWLPPFTMRSRCPFTAGTDQVVCHIKMGSWTYTAEEMRIELANSGVDTSDFVDNHVDWKLVGAVASREDRLYACCKEAYSLLHFNLTLKAAHPSPLTDHPQPSEDHGKDKDNHLQPSEDHGKDEGDHQPSSEHHTNDVGDHPSEDHHNDEETLQDNNAE